MLSCRNSIFDCFHEKFKDTTMNFCKLTSVVAAVTVSAALGSMTALADDDERAKCSIATAFVYQSTDFRLPVIDVYGSGFGEKRRHPKVQLAGVEVGAFVVESSDTRVVLAFDPASTAALELFQAIPGPTDGKVDEAYPYVAHFQLSIKPRGKKQSACAPITITSGVQTASGPNDQIDQAGRASGLLGEIVHIILMQ
jgi:hypothetical protein